MSILTDRIAALPSGRRDEPSARRELAEVVAEVERLEQIARDSAYAIESVNRRRMADKSRQVQYRADRARRKAATEKAESLRKVILDSEVKKKERKNLMRGVPPDLFGHVPLSKDDWPEDFADRFWQRWPRHNRKFGQAEVERRLTKIRRSGKVTWAAIWGGLEAYFASGPDPRFIPAPAVWINKGYWTADFSKVVTGKRRSFMDHAREAFSGATGGDYGPGSAGADAGTRDEYSRGVILDKRGKSTGAFVEVSECDGASDAASSAARMPAGSTRGQRGQG